MLALIKIIGNRLNRRHSHEKECLHKCFLKIVRPIPRGVLVLTIERISLKSQLYGFR
jgi:hypothetical protein